MDAIRRITDLFIEGETVLCGRDDENKPIVIWVNKLNSFEVEEARRDGLAARGLRLIQLQKDDDPEFVSLRSIVDTWDQDTLAQRYVEQHDDQIGLEALNAVESNKQWREKADTIRRASTILADEGADPSDQRFQALQELNDEFLERINKERERIAKEKLADAKTMSRKALEKAFYERWRFEQTAGDFMTARRQTELFFAMRECSAVDGDRDERGRIQWDHSSCTHRRLLNERSQVRDLPEALLEKVQDALDRVTVGAREAGNLDVPASSSASSEQPKQAEESTPSIPVETSGDAPTT